MTTDSFNGLVDKHLVKGLVSEVLQDLVREEMKALIVNPSLSLANYKQKARGRSSISAMPGSSAPNDESCKERGDVGTSSGDDSIRLVDEPTCLDPTPSGKKDECVRDSFFDKVEKCTRKGRF